jgi:hypothetical protein
MPIVLIFQCPHFIYLRWWRSALLNRALRNNSINSQAWQLPY